MKKLPDHIHIQALRILRWANSDQNDRIVAAIAKSESPAESAYLTAVAAQSLSPKQFQSLREALCAAVQTEVAE